MCGSRESRIPPGAPRERAGKDSCSSPHAHISGFWSPGLVLALLAALASASLVSADDCNRQAPDGFRSDVAWDGQGLQHQSPAVQALFAKIWGTDDDLHVRTWAWQHNCRTQPRQAETKDVQARGVGANQFGTEQSTSSNSNYDPDLPYDYVTNNPCRDYACWPEYLIPKDKSGGVYNLHTNGKTVDVWVWDVYDSTGYWPAGKNPWASDSDGIQSLPNVCELHKYGPNHYKEIC